MVGCPCRRLRDGGSGCRGPTTAALIRPFQPHPQVEIRICDVVVLDHISQGAVQQGSYFALFLRRAWDSEGAASGPAKFFCIFLTCELLDVHPGCCGGAVQAVRQTAPADAI